jgi:uncharacterized membrane protein YccC
MRSLRMGALLAAVVAGPPLYGLVQDGGLDADTGLLRYGLVALGCAVGAGWIGSLVRAYEADASRRRREALIEQAREALESLQSQESKQQRPPGSPS